MKSKGTATVLAFLLGGIGAHKFYLGRTLAGMMYLVFCMTFIPALLAVVDGVVLVFMSEQEFDSKYNLHALLKQPQSAPSNHQIAQSVVVNIPGLHGGGGAYQGGPNTTDQLSKLNDLRISGALTEAEFAAQKQKLLSS